MGNEYGEYATVRDTREVYLSSTKTVDDALILSFIRQVSRDIDRISRRVFYPVLETRYFNTPAYGCYDLQLNADLITLNSVTNGNGDALDITKLVLAPTNSLTKTRIRLLPNISNWKNGSNGFSDNAISVNGVWGNVYDRTAGWQWRFTLTAQLAINGTTFDATPGIFSTGMLLKIDTEFVYVTALTPANAAAIPATTVDTVTIERAVNGTTAAVHVITSLVYIWYAGYDIKMLTSAAAVAYYQLKSNPLASSYSVDGVNYQTPKDVGEFIRERLSKLTLLRMGMA